jgi:hypothetical protein
VKTQVQASAKKEEKSEIPNDTKLLEVKNKAEKKADK